MLEVNNLIGFGAGEGGEAHRYWRVSISPYVATVAIMEMQMRGSVGGANLATNTAKAISKILDDDRSLAQTYTNYLVSETVATFYDLFTSPSIPCWFGYDFDVPTAIAEIIVVGHPDYAVNNYPMQVEWSDDRITWTAIGPLYYFYTESINVTGCVETVGTYTCPYIDVGGTTNPWISMKV